MEAAIPQASAVAGGKSSFEARQQLLCTNDPQCKGIIQVRNKWMKVHPGQATFQQNADAPGAGGVAQSVKMKVVDAPQARVVGNPPPTFQQNADAPGAGGVAQSVKMKVV